MQTDDTSSVGSNKKPAKELNLPPPKGYMHPKYSIITEQVSKEDEMTAMGDSRNYMGFQTFFPGESSFLQTTDDTQKKDLD